MKNTARVRGLLLQSSLSVLTMLAPAMALAAPASGAVEGVAAAPDASREARVGGGTNRYGSHSDEELTALAANWDSLDRHQRRALLTEMKLRMARNGERKDVIHIRTERRYGRIIRQADGRVIRIETQVVQVRPVDPEDLEARHSFGVGFEQRIGSRREPGVASNPEGGSDRTSGNESDDGGMASNASPSLDSLLDSLAPSTQAPVVKRPPVYQVSDPKP